MRPFTMLQNVQKGFGGIRDRVTQITSIFISVPSTIHSFFKCEVAPEQKNLEEGKARILYNYPVGN